MMRCRFTLGSLIFLAGLGSLWLIDGFPTSPNSTFLGPSLVHADEGAAAWGDIKGQIVFADEEIPALAELNVDKDKEHCLVHGPLHSEDWVINKENKGVQNVFVWLAPDTPTLKGKLPIHPSLESPKDKEVTMDQPNCQFIPHAQGMRHGQNMVVKNSASITHNVNWQGNPLKNPGGNVLLPPGEKHVIDDLKADRLPLKFTCNIHPWMSAWVAVFEHPYFAVSDADGRFEIKMAPAGKYRLVIWQESVGYRGGSEGRKGILITIKPGETNDLSKLDLKSKYPD